MKHKTCSIALPWLGAQFLLSILAHAGDTVMTTSDAAETYNRGLEVVIDDTKTVTLTTSSQDGGKVYASFTPSSGVTQTSETGYGTTSQVDTYSFDSSCKGVINIIQRTLIHYDGTHPLTICTDSDAKEITFKVCIPQVKVEVTTPLSGRTQISGSRGYDFEDKVSVKGIDDPAQLQIMQQINCTLYQWYTNSGQYPLQSGVPYNSSGYETDSGWDWQLIDSNLSHGNLDHQRNITIYSGSSPDQYCTIMYRSAYYKDFLRRTSDHGQVCEFDWGYVWDNYNAQWLSTTSPPLPSTTWFGWLAGGTSYAALKKLGPGEFTGNYGIDGLPLPFADP